MNAPLPRAQCLRCRRPASHCYCALIPRLAPKTSVLFVQHPRERDVAIGTARMAHLGLEGSTFVEGVAVDDTPAVRAALDAGGAAVLFPGAGARDVEEWAAAPPRTLVVLDGTWSQAKKLLGKNPRLASLPRVGYRPPAPGNYRIRKEPSDEHLATVEAVAAVLGILEGDRDRYASLLAPFTFMVDRQLEAAASGGGRPLRRRARPSTAGGRTRLRELDAVRAQRARAVVFYAEANCHRRDARAAGAPELVHLVATRGVRGAAAPGVGDAGVASFEAILAPRRPLGDEVPGRIRVDERALRAGEDVAPALARFRAFCDGAHLCAWGPFARDLLTREGEPAHGFVDLRALTARVLGRSPGGIQGAAAALDADVGAPRAHGRAGEMLALLDGVLARLLRG